VPEERYWTDDAYEQMNESSTDSTVLNYNEIYTMEQNDSKYESLDAFIEAASTRNGDLFSMNRLLKEHPLKKKQQTKDLCPIVLKSQTITTSPLRTWGRTNRKHGQSKYKGPHKLDRVNDNGTVRLRQDTANGGAVYRTWNIRNIYPYKA
jgi:hypothetical protein